MSEGVLALFGVTIAAAIGEILLPGGESSPVRRPFRFLCALLILSVILSPLVSFLSGAGEWYWGELAGDEATLLEYEAILEDAVARRSAEALREGIALFLEKEYGVPPESSTVLVFFAADGTLQRVSVYLSGMALTQSPTELEGALSAWLNCSVEVR